MQTSAIWRTCWTNQICSLYFTAPDVSYRRQWVPLKEVPKGSLGNPKLRASIQSALVTLVTLVTLVLGAGLRFTLHVSPDRRPNAVPGGGKTCSFLLGARRQASVA